MYFINSSSFPVTPCFAATQGRSSSFCQIVVRETENRQLLHFFSLVRGICGSLMRSNGGRKLGSRVPCPFLQGRVAMLPTQLLSVLHKPRCVCVRSTRPSQKTRRNGAPTVLVMPARSKAWATRQEPQNCPIPVVFSPACGLRLGRIVSLFGGGARHGVCRTHPNTYSGADLGKYTEFRVEAT